MIFESMSQAIASTQMLQRFYSVIRIKDTGSTKILYDSDNSDMSHENPVSFTGQYNAALTISEYNHSIVLTTTIPVSIGGRSCYLELIQRAVNDNEVSQSASMKHKNIIHHMRKLAITDSLTSLYNRRYIYEQLPIDLAWAFQNDNPISVIYADIDYFKEINDKYGHIVGDYMLKEVADVLHQQVQRKDGWAARYGGDEFLICLPSTNKTSAARIANRIRKAVEVKQFIIDSNHLKMTCSFGVQTIYKKNGINSVDKVIELVDCKLYQAKNKGRNRVVV